MPFQVPLDLTWRTLFEASLLVVGDAALVAMIRDAPLVLLFAMVLASFGAFWALHFEDWLRAKHPLVFQGILGVCGLIFLGFVVFAANHSIQEELTKRGLKTLYAEAGPFIVTANDIEAMPFNTSEAIAVRQKKIDDLVADINSWDDKTASWLRHNLGETARERFLDTANLPTFCWTNDCNEYLGRPLNRLVNRKKNLSAVLENQAVYNQD